MTLRRPLVLAAGVRGELPNGDQLPIDALQLPKGLIDGLQMQWVSGTALTVTSGAAYIEGSGKVLRATSAIAKTGLSLSASTWYHVYLYDNAGTPDVEIVTNAPAAPYNGTARSKTGDTSRRYVGSVITDASGNIKEFTHINYEIIYNDISWISFSVSNGVAITGTSFNLSAFVPVSAFIARLQIGNNSSTSTVKCGVSSSVPSKFSVTLPFGQNITADVPLTSSLNAYYAYDTPTSAGCYIRATGYKFTR